MKIGVLYREQSSRSVRLTTHLRIYRRGRMSEAPPLRPLYALQAWTGTASHLRTAFSTMYKLYFLK